MSWDSAPIAKGNSWDAAPLAQSGRDKARADAQRRTANTPGIIRAISQGATFGFSDELDAKLAGLETRLNPKAQYTPQEAEQAVLAANRQRQGSFEKDHPVQNFLGQLGGGLALPLGQANTVRQAAVTGAVGGGLYGLGAAEGNTAQRLPQAAAGAAIGAATGGLLTSAANRLAPRATAPGVRGSIARPTADTPAARLMSEGVSLTPGQRMGGFAKTLEDRAMGTVPILGDAIRGARIRGNESLQRAATNRALRPIGSELPAEVATGTDSTSYAKQALSDAYDKALSQVQTAQVDEPLVQGLTRIREGLADLPADFQRHFQNIVDNRVTSRFENGVADGATLKDIQSQIRNLASEYGSSTDPAQRRMGSLFGDLSGELLGLAERNSPDGGAALRAANEGYANYVRVRNAGGKLGAESGRFTPAQLRNAVRAEDNTVGKGGFATGDSLMYGLADDAQSVMASKIPDSGTAGRIGLGALGATTLTNPAVGLPTIAGLTLAAAPYFATGRSTPAALSRVLGIAEQAASMGRPAPAVVRKYLQDARTALGVSHPFVRQLEGFISAAPAGAQPTDQNDPNAPAVTVETVGGMSVSDYLKAQQQRPQQ